MIPPFCPCGAGVDYLRSCYSTQFRFFSDRLDVLSDVAWYFCEPGAKPLPFPTIFGSNQWCNFQKEPTPILGEVIGAPRPWRDGSPPPLALTGLPCGTAADFAAGNPSPPLVPIVPVVWGVPPCCTIGGAVDCEILPVMGVETAAVSYALAALTWCVYEGQQLAADQVAAATIGPISGRADRLRPASTLPSWYAAWNARQVVVAIAGVETDVQLIAAAMALATGPVPQGGFGTDVYSALAGDIVVSEMAAAGVPFDRPLTVAGHSMGGAVGGYITARETQLRPTRVVAHVTFGSPRMGDSAMGAILQPAIKTRWEADGDVVPFIPPDVSVYTALLALVSLPIALNWAKFRPSGRGKRLTAAGDVFTSLADDASWADLAIIIAEFLVSLPFGPFTRHGISNYTLSLQNAVAMADQLPDPRCLNLAVIDQVVNNLLTFDVDVGAAFASDATENVATPLDAAFAVAVEATPVPVESIALAIAVEVTHVPIMSAALAFGVVVTVVPSVDVALAFGVDAVNVEITDVALALGADAFWST